MPRPKPLLDQLARQGKPLAEVVVTAIEGEDRESLCKILDALAPDISAEILPAYIQPDGVPTIYQLRLEATREAVRREFGWILKREKIYDSSEHDGRHPDAYCWHEVNNPQFFPDSLKGRLQALGLTQPGRSDNGRAYNVEYESSDNA